MRQSIIACFFVLCLALPALSYMPGELKPQQLTNEVRAKASQLLSSVSFLHNDVTLNKFVESKPEVIYFGNQLVNGMNYFLVFKNTAGTYVCFKAFESLSHEIESKVFGIGKSQEEATQKCRATISTQ